MRTHFGDPCIHCGIPHDDLPVGDCQGDPAKAKPLACRIAERRWDGMERYLVRFSDGRIESMWCHPSEHAPYFHFGHSDELIQPPRHDPKIKDVP